MTIALESEIVSTAFDRKTGHCIYVVERYGHRWTVELPQTELEALGPSLKARRRHLTERLSAAMLAEPDPPQAQQVIAFNAKRLEEFGRAPRANDPLPLPPTGVGGDVEGNRVT